MLGVKILNDDRLGPFAQEIFTCRICHRAGNLNSFPHPSLLNAIMYFIELEVNKEPPNGAALVVQHPHCAIVTAGGFQVPSPGGSIESAGGSFGQYSRITM